MLTADPPAFPEVSQQIMPLVPAGCELKLTSKYICSFIANSGNCLDFIIGINTDNGILNKGVVLSFAVGFTKSGTLNSESVAFPAFMFASISL